jgi:hypothetical protein
LARSCSDWHRLVELCGLSATLIADADSVYDPRLPNDRLLLGVKGTLSEAELFTLRTRLYEGRWNKASKGQLKFHLPVGYVLGEQGQWELDPDTQVRSRLAYVFASFRRLGVARRVLIDLKRNALDLPTRLTTKEGFGQLAWKAPTFGAVRRLLANPAYAGACVYGKRDYETGGRSSKTGKALSTQRARTEWPVCIEGHHPPYIGWDEFVQNQEQLWQNWNRGRGRSAVREGAALLQGLAVCGVCGRNMGVWYHGPKERRSPSYMCCRGYMDGEEGTCQSVAARYVDGVVADAFLEAVSPTGVEIAVRVLRQIETTLEDQRQQWDLQLEQARYEARAAQRQYDAADPENRLVTAELERRWNEKLERVARLETAYAKAEQESRWHISEQEREAIEVLARDLPAIWGTETTTPRDRKQLLRCAIEWVQLDGNSQPGWIEVEIHWRSGTVTRLVVERPSPSSWLPRTSPQAEALILELAPTCSYAEIAERLNEQGIRSAFGHLFTDRDVGHICRRSGVGRRLRHPSKPTAGRTRNELTTG